MNTKLLAQAQIDVNPPSFVPTNIGGIISWIIRLIFIVGGFVVLYELVMGGLSWILSSGDKEKVEKARKQITNAIIGLIILFITIAIVALLEQVFGLGMGITRPIEIPRFGSSTLE